MIDKIIALLGEKGLYGWELSQTVTRGWEFYFIRHELDQNRIKDVEHITLCVYQPSGEGFIGSASAEIAPTATLEEVRRLIDDLSYRASLVQNKLYALNAPKAGQPVREEADLAEISRNFISAVRGLPETEGEDVNSYEVFASQVTRRLITSTGIDVTETAPVSMLEAVVNARRDGHEIEVYRNIRCGTCDAASVSETLKKAMTYGHDRLSAQKTPALGAVDVLFSGQDACSLYEFFTMRMHAAMICRRMSDWSVGKSIYDGGSGDWVTVKALKCLPNSSHNAGFDAEGAPIEDTFMIEAGVPKRVLGGRMFSSYLGLEDSFIPGNIEVSGGTASEGDLRAGQYLEAVEFSDFQVDPMTGDIFGELRLGYLHDGKGGVKIVTGGSISGSMFDLYPDMRFSAAQAQYNDMRIPALTRLYGVTLTGAAE